MKQIQYLVHSIDMSWDSLIKKLSGLKESLNIQIDRLILPTPVCNNMFTSEVNKINEIPFDLLCAVYLPT